MFEFARDRGGDRSARAHRLQGAIGGLLKTPLIAGIAVGLVFGLNHWTLPAPASAFVGLLAAAAGPSALFAIGASLGERRIELSQGVPEMVLLKLIAHPALVALAMWAMGADPRLAAVGVLAATLPTASNTFILSQRYGADTRPVGSALALGTVLAVVTVSAFIWLLGLTAR
jgi:predicted permease